MTIENQSVEKTFIREFDDEDKSSFSVDLLNGEGNSPAGEKEDKSGKEDEGKGEEETPEEKEEREAKEKEEEDALAKEAEETGKTVEELKKEKEKAAKTKGNEEEEEEEEILKPTDPPGFQKRINKMRKIQGDLERKLQERDEELRTLKTASERKNALGKEPVAGDFETEEEYHAALVNYNVKKALAEEAEATVVKQAEESKKRAEDEKKDKDAALYRELSEGSKKYKDFDTVVMKNADLKISQDMVMIAEEMSNMVDIFYYLGKHPSVSAEIAGLSTVQATIRINKISEDLVSKVKKIPSAPPPITPVKAKGGGVKDLSDLPMDEYRKRREGKK